MSQDFDDFVDANLRRTAEAQGDETVLADLGKAGLLDKKVYANPEAYQKFVVAERQRTMSSFDPMRDLEHLVERYPDITPETLVAGRLLGGIDPESEVYEELIKLDRSRKERKAELDAATKAEIDAAKAEVEDADKGILGTAGQAVVDTAQFGTRWGFAGLSAAGHIIRNAGAFGVAKAREAVTGEDLDTDWGAAFTSTEIGAAMTLMMDEGIGSLGDDGGGWFMGGKIEEVRQQQAKALVVDAAGTNDFADLGSETVQLFNDVGFTSVTPNEGVGRVVAGVLNVGSYASDPSMYVGAGTVNRAAKGAKAGVAAVAADDSANVFAKFKAGREAAVEAELTTRKRLGKLRGEATTAAGAQKELRELDHVAAWTDSLPADEQALLREAGIDKAYYRTVSQQAARPHLKAATDAETAASEMASVITTAKGFSANHTPEQTAKMADFVLSSPAFKGSGLERRATTYRTAVDEVDDLRIQVRDLQDKIDDLAEVGTPAAKGQITKAKAKIAELNKAASKKKATITRFTNQSEDFRTALASHLDEAQAAKVAEAKAARKAAKNASRAAADEVANTAGRMLGAIRNFDVDAMYRATSGLRAPLQAASRDAATALARSEGARIAAAGEHLAGALPAEKAMREFDHGVAVQEAAMALAGKAKKASAAMGDEVTRLRATLGDDAVDQALLKRQIDDLEAKQADLDTVTAMYEKRIVEEAQARQNIIDTKIDIAQRFAAANHIDASELENITTIDGLKDFYARYAGVMDLPNGGRRVDVDRAMEALAGKHWEDIFATIAHAKDPAKIMDVTGKEITVKLARELAEAGDVEAVRAAMFRAIADGSLDSRLSSLHVFRGKNIDLDGLSRAATTREFAEALGMGHMGRLWMRTKRAGDAAVPWAHALHIEDEDGIYRAAVDTFDYVAKEFNPFVAAKRGKDIGGAAAYARELDGIRTTMANRLIHARTASERFVAWNATLEDMAKFAAKAQGLDETGTAAMMKAFREVKDMSRDARSFNADLRAMVTNDADLPPYLSDVLGDGSEGMGKLLKALNKGQLEVDLGERIMMPDPREMRAAFAAYGDLAKVGKRATMQAAEDLFLNMWKRLVIAWRVTYMIRNTIEGGVRQHLSGHPNVITSPHTLWAMALQGRELSPAMQKLVDRAGLAGNDILGNTFSKTVDDTLSDSELFLDAANAHQSVLQFGHSLMDVNVLPDALRTQTIRQVDQQQVPEFAEGLAFQLQRWESDPFASQVMSVLAGKPSGALKKLADERFAGDVQRALAYDIATSEAGRKVLANIMPLGKNREVLQGGSIDGVHAFLFGTDAASLASRIRAHVNNDTEVLARLVGKEWSPASLGRTATVKDINAQTAALADLLRTRNKDLFTAGKYPVKSTQVRNLSENLGKVDKSYLMQRYDAIEQKWFWGQAAKVERNFMREPEFKFAYWEHSAALIQSLSKADAAEVLKAARKALGGNKVADALSPTWRARTLREIEAAAKNADGTGAYTLDMMHKSAGSTAAKHVSELFYDAYNRNQMAHALRFAFPFAQAWGNTIKSWGTLAAKNSHRVYKATVVYDGLTNPASGEFVSELPFADDYVPGNGVIYRDEATGQMMVRVPVVGGAMSALASALSGGRNNAPIDMTTPIQSWNIAFQGNGLPGVGPVLQVPLGLVRTTNWYQSMPDWVQEWVHPFDDPSKADDGIVEKMTPKVARAALAYVGSQIGTDWFEAEQQKYIHQAAATLYSKGGYDLSNPADTERLYEDAKKFSGQLQMSRWLASQSLGGTAMQEFYVQTKDSSWVPQTVVADAFNKMVEHHEQDYDKALAELVDTYGTQVLFVVQGKSSGAWASQEGWTVTKANPKFAEDNADVWPMFFDGQETSIIYERWLAENGQGREKKDLRTVIGSVSNILMSLEKDQVNKRLAAGEITDVEAEAAYTAISKNYSDANPDADAAGFNNWDQVNQIESIAKAVEDGSPLLEYRVGKTVRSYVDMRATLIEQARSRGLKGLDDTNPFSGDEMAGYRTELMEQGEALAAEYPQFRNLWSRAFKRELVEE